MFHRLETRALAAAVLIASAGLAGCGTPEGAGQAEAQGEDRVSRGRALVAEGATLLDVRTPGEWTSGHLDGATSIPVQELSSRLAEVPRERPVVVYCASGRRSAAAVEMLRAQGYDAHDLGGMPSAAAWAR